ncbi:MAG: 1,4-alpha-glucan-branching enzyme, partial [Lentisphaeria bacterium]|nr:1,4-alpha-glucan-branching enzyme [Lentisphaeria bacterium]
MSKESSPFAPRSNAPLPLAKDAFLQEYAPVLRQRKAAADRLERRLAGKNGSLADFACAHEYYGLHRKQDHWVFREYAPGAAAIWLVGDFSHWQKE